jgi:hypothetical protein
VALRTARGPSYGSGRAVLPEPGRSAAGRMGGPGGLPGERGRGLMAVQGRRAARPAPRPIGQRSSAGAQGLPALHRGHDGHAAKEGRLARRASSRHGRRLPARPKTREQAETAVQVASTK